MGVYVDNFSDKASKTDFVSAITEDGSIDRRGNPAVKSKTGGWKIAILLLVNYGLATFAFFGLGVNLVLFLTRVMEQDNAHAATNVSKWTGTVYIFSLFGAFMSDSYWGRFLTCAIFQFAYVLGLVLLSMSSWLLLVKPDGCGDNRIRCDPVTTTGSVLFYLSIYLIAFGNGGYQPSIATFGADQFDENDPKESISKVTFFSYFYFAMNFGSLFSNTILVYYEDSGRWTVGFFTSATAAALAMVVFFSGCPWYRHFRPSGNPLTRIAQVVVSTVRKWKVRVPDAGGRLYEIDGKESAIAGVRKIPHTNEFKFLDKAATTVTRKDDNIDDKHQPSPWKLCTVTQVEEVKSVLKMLPIWMCTIIYSVLFTQMASIFVEQGEVMDTRFFGFKIPPASMSAFDICTVLVCILLYNRVLVKVMRRYTGNRRGLSELQRMGIGLVIGMLAMVVAGVVEIMRRPMVVSVDQPSKLSIFWQIPQYVLIGSSEVFMYVGQLEFFNGQAPDGIKSFGSSLCMASISLGNYISGLLVFVVMNVTAGDGDPGWIPENLNVGRLELFFFLLAGLAVVDLVVYYFCAKWYELTKMERLGSYREACGETIEKV